MEKKSGMGYKRLVWLLIGLGMGFYLASHPILQDYVDSIYRRQARSVEQQAMKDLKEVYSILKKQYYFEDKLDPKTMWDGSIQGFVSAIDDPFTEFLPTEENKEFEERLTGTEEFEGIGAAVRKKDDYVEIQEVFKGTPAALAGLLPLDRIVEIDGERTQPLTISEAVAKIRGEKGTVVTLLIYRPSEQEPEDQVFEVEVTRQNVTIPSVSVELLPVPNTENNIAYVEIALIGENTETYLKEELAQIADKNIVGVLLDLRGNGGGLLPKAVDIVSHFMDEGQVVVVGRYSILPTETYVSKAKNILSPSLPIVVLVDQLTASAGEIIAGALRQNRGATLVGETTFGKGSIQTLQEVAAGSLKYTIGRWYLPDNSNVDETGLEPDIEIEFDVDAFKESEIDTQKNAGLEYLLKIVRGEVKMGELPAKPLTESNSEAIAEPQSEGDTQ